MSFNRRDDALSILLDAELSTDPGWLISVADNPAMSFSRAVSAAGVLFFDEHDRILLVEPTYKEHWDIPGGYVELGETPTQACTRELTEELGLTVKLRRLLVVDWAPSETEGDKILFVFDGGQLTQSELATISLNRTELASYEFVSPATMNHRLIPRLTRRLAAAVDARHSGHTVYLEHGVPAFSVKAD